MGKENIDYMSNKPLLIRVTAKKSYTSMNALVHDTAQEVLDKLRGGELSKRAMHKTGSSLEVIDVSTTDLKEFKRMLSEYQVDFAVVSDKNTGKYEVMYKCKDMSLVEKAFENSLSAFKEQKPSLTEQLALASKKVKEQDVHYTSFRHK